MEIKKTDKKILCAIYTRVSTSEGLAQEFSSLDNQRESAESYIQSQKSEGWVASSERYDDGGFTGANTERPALQQLVDDEYDAISSQDFRITICFYLYVVVMCFMFAIPWSLYLRRMNIKLNQTIQILNVIPMSLIPVGRK